MEATNLEIPNFNIILDDLERTDSVMHEFKYIVGNKRLIIHLYVLFPVF